MISAEELPRLVRAAAGDDPRAWDRLVGEYTPAIRGVARGHKLGAFDQDDVVQRTWIALIGSIGRLRDPSSLPCWLTTTARREAVRIRKSTAREFPNQDLVESHAPAVLDEDRVLATERRDVARQALAVLAPQHRELLTALAAEPKLSYKQVSERVGIPVGSIGPTRQRCLERMRRDPRVGRLLDEYAAPGRPARPVRPPVELV